MDQSSVAEAVKQICDEKGIPMESVIQTIEAALAAAYRKDFGEKNQNIKVEFDLATGKLKVFDVKTVVEDVPEEELKKLEEETGEKGEKTLPAAKTEVEPTKKIKAGGKDTKKDEKRSEKSESETEGEREEEIRRFNPKTDLQISDAVKIKKSYKIGDEIKTELKVPGEFGRMAAQTAKQVIVQKLRETEREAMYEELKKQEGEILVGTVQRKEGTLVLVDLGRLTALLPPEEQIRNESYTPGAHIKVYIVSVTSTTKGPEVIVSRSHPEIVKKLFALEIPEIANGVVEIKSIAREAGSRSKIAVWTDQENIDPIGSCIGQRGARIQTIISELKGEKVDIIKYSDDTAEYIANALSPAKILGVKISDKEKTAEAKVVEDQLSLAIGKAGQNVRLAARLTGWKIDITSDGNKKADKKTDEVDEKDVVDEKDKEKTTEKDDKKAKGSKKESKEEEPAAEKKKVSDEKKKVKDEDEKNKNNKKEKEVKKNKKNKKPKEKKESTKSESLPKASPEASLPLAESAPREHASDEKTKDEDKKEDEKKDDKNKKK